MSKDAAKTVTAIVLAVVLGGGALAYGGLQIQRVREIERGPAAPAHATDWITSPSRGRTVYRVKYAFARAGSDHTGGPVRVSQDVYDRTRAGAPLIIRSAPERPDGKLPEEAIVDAKSDAALVVFTGALVLVFVSIAVVLVWAAKRAKAKAVARGAIRTGANFPKDPPPSST
jgi:hypothetical protein